MSKQISCVSLCTVVYRLSLCALIINSHHTYSYEGAALECRLVCCKYMYMCTNVCVCVCVCACVQLAGHMGLSTFCGDNPFTL